MLQRERHLPAPTYPAFLPLGWSPGSSEANPSVFALSPSPACLNKDINPEILSFALSLVLHSLLDGLSQYTDILMSLLRKQQSKMPCFHFSWQLLPHAFTLCNKIPQKSNLRQMFSIPFLFSPEPSPTRLSAPTTINIALAKPNGNSQSSPHLTHWQPLTANLLLLLHILSTWLLGHHTWGSGFLPISVALLKSLLLVLHHLPKLSMFSPWSSPLLS